MPPEAGVPGAVQFLQRAVALPQPAPVCLLTVIAVAVSAVFIGNVPRRETASSAVPLRKLSRKAERIRPEHLARGADILTPSEFVPPSPRVRPVRLRIARAHPGGLCRRRRRENHLHPVRFRKIHDFVESAEIIDLLRGLQQRPGKHVHRQLRDMCLMKQPHILRPALLRPLLRVIISTEQNLMYPW